ncbi:Holliday junction branch migration protein RuvA [Nitrospira sp. Kam-Ns4a]
MIAALTGRLTSKAPSLITLDVQGVGYEVHIPLSTYYTLPDANEVASLHIHTYLRDDAIQLFGFSSFEEKGAFLLLTGVSGIGPKLALSVLSALSVSDLISAVRAGDVEKLATVPGIGKKSAGRIALELKDKIERFHPALAKQAAPQPALSGRLQEDALSALVNLGYKPAEVKAAIKRVLDVPGAALSLKELIRDVLKALAKGGGR